MRFKVDENLPVEAAELLRAAGHDSLTVLDQEMGGRADRNVADAIRDEKRALVTLDLDFADIRAFPPDRYSGLIVLRLSMQDKPRILALIDRMIPLLDTEPVSGMLWIVDETAIRIRGEAI